MSDALAVSVVMGVRDGAVHLPAAMDSILSQRGVDLELIVVDDGSTDATAGLLAQYEERDPRVRRVASSGRGLTRALIAGVEAARAPFVARQDADDVSLPGRLERQARLLAGDPGLSFVASAFRYVGPAGERMTDGSPVEDSEAATARLRRPSATGLVIPRHGSVMFRRTAYVSVGGYRPEFYFAQDLELWTRLAEVGRLAYVPEVLYEVRFDDSCVTALHGIQQRRLRDLVIELVERRRRGESEAPVLERAAAIGPVAGSARRLRAQAAYFIGSCLADRHDPRARAYLARAARLDPLHLKAWWKLAMRPWA